MDLSSITAGLMSPVILAFALGVIAQLVRSDLRIPPQVYTALSIYLLFAIGLKGGRALAQVSVADVGWPALTTLLLGIIVPLIAYAIARGALRFENVDAAALAAHYGSVSAVTFATAMAFLDIRQVSYEGYMPALVALLEVPAIVIGVLIARSQMPGKTAWGQIFHEVLTGKSIVLLVGGLVIGRFCTPESYERVSPVFVNLFFGALVLFMLDMGTVAAERMREIGRAGVRLIVFALLMPVIGGLLAMVLGAWSGMSVGGNIIFAVLGASASYIAAPAAIRIALPEANAGYYLTASIGITFPFNLALGIPLFYSLTIWYRG
jgi:uncharacterized protein